ncbi:MAG: hypothetical protein LBO72_05920 [Helicobacteraceae bacterium]|jgi:hypothetical protein|nr:hypothetical protein [Helicobacteraceae bacterium]
MKTTTFFIFLALVGALGASSTTTSYFETHSVSVYKGKIIVPDKFKKDSEGVWRDEFGKGMDEPHINFAGKYFLSLHSCGAECRYYQLADLTSGRSVSGLEMFASGDPPNLTREGYRYMTILDYGADSRAIVAQYQIDTDIVGEYDCRERVFVFDETEQIKPISKTRYGCGEFVE